MQFFLCWGLLTINPDTCSTHYFTFLCSSTFYSSLLLFSHKFMKLLFFHLVGSHLRSSKKVIVILSPHVFTFVVNHTWTIVYYLGLYQIYIPPPALFCSSELSTGHFSWTRPDPAKPWPDPTRDCRQKVWPNPTRGPTLPPYVHSLIE